MVEKRPFVDRRLALTVLFERQRGVDLEAEEQRTLNSLNDQLDSMNYSVFVTHVQATNNPPQMRIIFNESAMRPEVIQDISDNFKQSFEEVGGIVQTIQVSSVALSPGDKVRNALPV